MYETFYKLQAEPFRLSPDHRFCYEHKGYTKARAYMAYAFSRAEGFVMITGRPGTGKTTLIGDLLETLSQDNVTTANLVCTQLQADDLLKTVAYSFGVGSSGLDKAELLQRLNVVFRNWHREGRRALLIVDEAQDLSTSAMEELRLLTNIQVDGQPLLQIFMLGQPELRELILSPEMEQVHQRIVAASHLEALELQETEAYIRHRLEAVGWRGDPAISKAIFPLIYRFSEGVPRRINLIFSRLMLHGCVEQRHKIGVRDIRDVIKELQGENLAAGSTFSEDDFMVEDEFDQESKPKFVPRRHTVDSPSTGQQAVGSVTEPAMSVEQVPEPAEPRLHVAADEVVTFPEHAPVAGSVLQQKKKDSAALVGRSQPVLADISESRTTDVGHSGPAATEDTRATLDKPAEALAVRQVETSRNDDGPEQSEVELAVPQKPMAGTSVSVILAIIIIALLIIFAVFFALRQDKWHTWQDEITNWWTDFSVRQGVPEAPGSNLQPAVEVMDPDFELTRQTDSEMALPFHSEAISEPIIARVDEHMESPEAGTLNGEDQVLLVEFAFDSTDLSADSRGILDQVVAAMVRSGDSSAVITGYSDNRGAADYNLDLSYKRADVVAQYLVSRNIERHRLRIEGLGSDHDLSEANTRELDSEYGVRRVVEIRIGTNGLQ